MDIKIASTDQDISACFSVLKQLRPNISESTFVADIRRMEKEGFRLVFLADPDVKAVAGYRTMEMLATGKVLYVDDLVTDNESRSAGYGGHLLGFLVEEAKKLGCAYFELDSGTNRLDAHRFYRRQGLSEIATHFSMPLGASPKWSENLV